MLFKINFNKFFTYLLTSHVLFNLFLQSALAEDSLRTTPGNFGFPGILDLPTAKRFPDGELVVTQQLHSSLARSGISFQALPRLGFSFRYTGHGVGGREAYGRVNHDRSFDAHISLLTEQKYLPEISIGLRDFIGTGWYSSEYLVGTKSIGKLELTTGLGFGRLAGKGAFSNPFSILSPKFDERLGNTVGQGGTLSSNSWFKGDAATFFGFRYQLGKKVMLLSEYTPDLMSAENSYLNVKSPWNIGLSYQINDYINLSTQFLHGSQVSVAASIITNPNRPPLLGGKELAPVPMRLREQDALSLKNSNQSVIKKVLAADRFEVHYLNFESDSVSVAVSNTKFRSTAQAVGRLASTLQRFTSDKIKFAHIAFYSQGLQTANYQVDLEKVTTEQYNPSKLDSHKESIEVVDAAIIPFRDNADRFTWGVGPYITHRLFNPDLPLSMETGIEAEAGYRVMKGLKISGAIRKSVLTNLTDNERRSNSVLPRVHSDWPLYDFAGQSGHIHALAFSYVKNIAPGFYGRAQAGLLEPFFAGIGGELLYKPAQSPLSIGFDMHRVRKRDYDMKFDLLDYETTVGHISLYYDAAGMFDIEINAGRFLAGDWGATTTITRKFGSGWEVGGYATLTDVPFETFGEGSFDKAIFVSIPLDWITSTPTKAKRILSIRPITRDGGAHLASARSLNRLIERSQYAAFRREYGRIWK